MSGGQVMNELGPDASAEQPAIAAPYTYDQLIERLSRLHAERAVEEREVESWFADQRRAAEEAVARSARRIEAAREARATMDTRVQQTQQQAVQIWRALQNRLDRRRRSDPLVTAPPPMADEAVGTPEPARAAALLSESWALLDRIVEGQPTRTRASGRLILVLLLLAAAAGLAAAIVLR